MKMLRTSTWFALVMLLCLLAFIVIPRHIPGQSASQHGILVTWTATSTSGATYVLYRATSASGTCGAFTQIATGITADSYSDPASGLTAGTTYCYEVDAEVGTNLSGPSNVATVVATFPSNPAPPSGCAAIPQ